MYLPDEADPNVIYVFATRGGTPVNPDWYYNLTAEGEGTVERGTETYNVTVRDVTGDERDRIYAEQARRPWFRRVRAPNGGSSDHPCAGTSAGVGR